MLCRNIYIWSSLGTCALAVIITVSILNNTYYYLVVRTVFFSINLSILANLVNKFKNVPWCYVWLYYLENRQIILLFGKCAINNFLLHSLAQSIYPSTMKLIWCGLICFYYLSVCFYHFRLGHSRNYLPNKGDWLILLHGFCHDWYNFSIIFKCTL